MKIGKISVVVIGLVPFNVYAECTPTPDYDAIGYTETSCEGDSLKCPFDTSKMKCIPCDSSFRYDCVGDNITGGTGSACNGKYVSCECNDETVFNNGECVCDTSCSVGNIYYSDGSCSSCVDSNKTAIGVVVKDDELIIGQIIKTSSVWGGAYTNVTDLTDYTNSTDAQTDFNGKTNTAIIVTIHKKLGETANSSSAIACFEYFTSGTNAGDWYLPAAGEFYSYIYANYSKINSTMSKLNWTFGSRWFWSSTEKDGARAWYIKSDTGATFANDNKYFGASTSCLYSID